MRIGDDGDVKLEDVREKRLQYFLPMQQCKKENKKRNTIDPMENKIQYYNVTENSEEWRKHAGYKECGITH